MKPPADYTGIMFNKKKENESTRDMISYRLEVMRFFYNNWKQIRLSKFSLTNWPFHNVFFTFYT
jgi:hypothetical protein